MLEKIIIAVLLFSVVFSALAQGVVDPWSVAVLELLGVLLLLLWSAKVVTEKRLTVQVQPLLLPVLALFALGVMQSVALTGGDGAIKSLSMDVEATRKAVFLFFFLVVGLLVAANTFTARRRLRALANFLVIYGVLMAMFALVQHFTWNGKFYWFKPNRTSTSPFGPFVSHNHFAGYMVMLIPLALALAISRGQKIEARLFYGFAAAMMGTAAVASLSRGGIISLAATLLFLAVCKLFLDVRRARGRSRHAREEEAVAGAGHSRRRARRAAGGSVFMTAVKGAALAVAIIAVIVVGLVWVGPDRLAGRVTAGSLTGGDSVRGETFFSSRGWIWRDSWAMIKGNPVFGVGFGAFETAHPIYSESDGSLIVGQAHNDYLQILADAGIIGGIIALWFIALFFRELRRGMRSRDDALAAISLGTGGGIFAILVHSVFDFNLQLPSNVLLFFILVAMLAQSVALVRRNEDASAGEQRTLSALDVRRTAKSLAP